MLEVLYEDNHLLVVNKPAMLPTMGVADDVPSLLSLAKEYIRKKYHKPGNVYMGIVSRLDAPVTGVVLMARTSKAAGRLAKQFRERDVEKIYWAIVEGHLAPPNGILIDFLRKDERHRRMHITGANATDAQRAELNFRVLATDKKTMNGVRDRQKASAESTDDLETTLSPSYGPVSLVEIRPLTGRKHQIRIQMSHAGYPILGDRKYGGRRVFSLGIALHSRRLVVQHPVNKMQLEIEARTPRAWETLGLRPGS